MDNADIDTLEAAFQKSPEVKAILDTLNATRTQAIDLMIDTAKKQGTAFVVVTHDPHLASRCGRVLRLDRGVLQT